MTIYAHPADTVTNCGGTLARHADQGDDITALILTHGGRIHPNRYAEEGRKDDPDRTITGSGLDDVITNKKDELSRAAKILGIDTVITLDRDDAVHTVQDDLVEEVARQVATVQPDVMICDYPLNPANSANPHTAATMTALAGIGRAGSYLQNLDGRTEVNVKQIFFTSLPVFANESLSSNGIRNDLYIDITDVVGRKIAAMDCFASQGYDGPFARKLIESNNGEFGRTAGVNFAEAYVRHYNETRTLLPVTSHAESTDVLTRHLSYSRIDLRREHPIATVP